MKCTVLGARLTALTWSSLPPERNCFSSLSVGSNKSLTMPNSYTGPIYINGGSVTFRGDFTCAELHDRAHQQDGLHARSATSRPMPARTSISPRRRAARSRALRSTGTAALRIARTATRSTAIRRRSSPVPCISRPRNCSTTALEQRPPHARCSSPSGSRSPATAARATSSRSLPTAAPRGCPRTHRRGW